MTEHDVVRRASKIVHYEHARLAQLANMRDQETKADGYRQRWHVAATVLTLIVASVALATTPPHQAVPSWWWWLASGGAYVICRTIGRIVYLRRSPW